MSDCAYPEGMSWKPDGVHDVDPCIYQDVEMHTNATVIVSRCVKCGKTILSWLRTEDTEDIDMTEDGGDVFDE